MNMEANREARMSNTMRVGLSIFVGVHSRCVGWLLRAMALLIMANSQFCQSAMLKSATDTDGCRNGYRQQSIIRDFALRQDWLVFASCAHPEMPRVAVAVNSPPRPFTDQSVSPAATLVIRSGARVRLWRQDPVTRINLSGVALDAGTAGAIIRVRVGPNAFVLRGTVRSADSVELEAANGTGFVGAGQ
jgi:hypothetical protein